LQPAAVEWVVWIHSIIKNKANLKNHKIDVSPFKTSKYEISPAGSGKNQTQYKANLEPINAHSKPNKPNSKPILHPCPIYRSTIYSGLKNNNNKEKNI
jgi:hypothetical protein